MGVAVVAAVFSGACMTADEEVADDLEFVSDRDLDAAVTVTRVELTEHGVGRIEQWHSTRRLQLQEAEREAALLERGLDVGTAQDAVTVRQSSCPSTDFRMWEDTLYSGEQICFYGTAGTVVLDDYVYGCTSGFCAHWGGQVRSLKPGSHFGYVGACGGSCTDLNSNDLNYTGPSEVFYFRSACGPC